MLDKKKPRFLRSDWYKKSRLGKKRKKKQVWRHPKGRHSKKREKKKSRGKQPSIGYGRTKSERGKILGARPFIINNVKDLLNVKKDQIATISSKVGTKKKIEIAKKALELKTRISNLDPKDFLDKMSKIIEGKKEKDKKESSSESLTTSSEQLTKEGENKK